VGCLDRVSGRNGALWFLSRHAIQEVFDLRVVDSTRESSALLPALIRIYRYPQITRNLALTQAELRACLPQKTGEGLRQQHSMFLGLDKQESLVLVQLSDEIVMVYTLVSAGTEGVVS